MRVYIFLVLFLLLFCCKSNKKNPIIKENLNVDSLSMVVLGDVRFGMNVNELFRTEVLNKSSYGTDCLLFDFEIDNEIYSGGAQLQKGVLFKIIFESEKQTSKSL